MVIERLLEDISKIMRMDKISQERFVLVLSICQQQKFMGIHEFRQLTELGIPIGKILKTILIAPMEQVRNTIENKSVSYEDLICCISIFAQDLMFRNQGYNK